MDTTDTEPNAPEVKRSGLKAFFKNPAKLAFWSWVGYQAIKGTMTTTFIWAPLLYMWFHHR